MGLKGIEYIVIMKSKLITIIKDNGENHHLYRFATHEKGKGRNISLVLNFNGLQKVAFIVMLARTICSRIEAAKSKSATSANFGCILPLSSAHHDEHGQAQVEWETAHIHIHVRTYSYSAQRQNGTAFSADDNLRVRYRERTLICSVLNLYTRM